MIVPQYWAECRRQVRRQGRQFTVRRFGWSDVSQEDAQRAADDRADEALDRILAGDKLTRREPKVPYGGADGVPIREEIVARHGEVVVTRNSYGAHCLNTPNVLFADVDFLFAPGCGFTVSVMAALLCGAAEAGWATKSWFVGVVAAFIALFLGLFLAGPFHRLMQYFSGGPEGIALGRLQRFLEKHPAWSVRVYRTPAGLRVLAMHRPFDPSDPEVAEFFAALRTDPIYVRMCLNQRCFRARLTPKPWRIGVQAHLTPRPGVWPVAPERLPARRAWIEKYEAAARDFAACEFLESLGSGASHPEAKFVQDLHDQLSGARTGAPIA